MQSVEIELGGKTRRLRMTLGAMARFEKATGVNMLALGEGWQGSATQVQALLWACLVSDEPGLTQEQVGDWVDPSNMEMVMTKLVETWNAATPEGQGDPLPPEGRTENP